ncbi:MAG TPA: ATP-binding protein, partial [Ktedonobacteraceae bacterium]|nr:ATP-binding protein [Ktedonobacteraceae bacterium]
NEEQWNILAETVPQFVWSTRPDGFLEYWNKQFSDYLQAPSESIRGQGWRQFIYPNDLARVIAIRSRSLKAGEPYEIECRLKDGQTANYNWFLVRAAPVHDAIGRIIRWFGTCTNIESQKRLEATLRQNQERIQALMESTIIGIIVTDNEKVITANDAFLYMTGYNQEDLQNGQLTFSLLQSPESSTPDLQALEELVNFRQAKPYETICVCKDGSLLPILAGVVALPHHPSQTIGFLLDNSARKELEQRKDDFISMASHELKTPIKYLKLQVQLLEKQLARQSNAQTVPALASIEKQARHLERLVEAFLDVSKIQAGKLDYLQERVNIDELIYELVEAMQQINPTRTITVHGTTRAILLADRDRLRQVFTNLISNATKYSPQASPVAIEISKSPEAISIEVRDQGIGVPREQREKIFERFYRAVPSSQKESPGLGMGLYIAAQIVKHYKGTISVEDARGKGSTFRVTLPPRDSEAKCSIPF